MVVVILRYSTVSDQYEIPAELEGSISREVWNDLRREVNDSAGQAACIGCAGEIIVCLIGIWCIFCCHLCIFNALRENDLSK